MTAIFSQPLGTFGICSQKLLKISEFFWKFWELLQKSSKNWCKIHGRSKDSEGFWKALRSTGKFREHLRSFRLLWEFSRASSKLWVLLECFEHIWNGSYASENLTNHFKSDYSLILISLENCMHSEFPVILNKINITIFSLGTKLHFFGFIKVLESMYGTWRMLWNHDKTCMLLRVIWNLFST